MMMVMASGGVESRVRESDGGDRIDRGMGSLFGLRRKSSPETFSAVVVVVAGLRELAGEVEWEREINWEYVTPVARIEAIRLFLAYASFKEFVVYLMDVKCTFLYGKIEEEVYVCQPPGFEDPDFPDKVYKLEKALYGLHQAPRAWYETLSTYLLDNGFQRGQIDKTLFIRRDKGNILLVQVYIDDIIFVSTKKSLCTEFEKMMHKKFQISSIGELTFFLGLQVKQKDDGISISQDKPDIMFAVCASARYQVSPKVSHLHAISDYAGASLDRKSTTGGCHIPWCRLCHEHVHRTRLLVANSQRKAEYGGRLQSCLMWTRALDSKSIT
ncbi:putative ribonuclease H-like domain-containing protein [Tanacetum coccineum]